MTILKKLHISPNFANFVTSEKQPQYTVTYRRKHLHPTHVTVGAKLYVNNGGIKCQKIILQKEKLSEIEY